MKRAFLVPALIIAFAAAGVAAQAATLPTPSEPAHSSAKAVAGKKKAHKKHKKKHRKKAAAKVEATPKQ